MVEELALIASAWQLWWIVLAAIPSGYSTGRCWQTGGTREPIVVLLLVTGRQPRGQVICDFSHPPALFISMVRGTRDLRGYTGVIIG